jgi:hypothetical protein
MTTRIHPLRRAPAARASAAVAAVLLALALRRPGHTGPARLRHLRVRPRDRRREPLRRVEPGPDRARSIPRTGRAASRSCATTAPETMRARSSTPRRARSSRAPERLPGLPDRRCLERRGCGPVTGTSDELELYGEHLAQTASTFTDVRFGRRLTELRLVDVETGRSEQIGARGAGESGQRFIGPSFDAGRLYTYFTCRGDTGGCVHGIGGAYRYRYSTGDWAKAPDARQLAGFAVQASGTYVQPVTGACGRPGSPGTPCAIVERVPAPDYRPTSRAPRTT